MSQETLRCNEQISSPVSPDVASDVASGVESDVESVIEMLNLKVDLADLHTCRKLSLSTTFPVFFYFFSFEIFQPIHESFQL